jgi:hypothetical protein
MAEDDQAPRRATYNVSGKPWGIAEGERIFLSIRPDEDDSLARRGFDYTFVPNPRDPEATVEITLHHQRRGKVEGTWADQPFLLHTLKAGEAIRLVLDSDETRALFRHLEELYAIGAEGVPRGDRAFQVHDADAVVATGDLATHIQALVERHGERAVLAGIQALVPDPIEVVALKREHEMRSAALAEFETRLAWDDWSELEWQAFFKRNDWIFGHGLDYHFLVSQQSQPDYGGEDLGGKGGQRGDELMSTPGDVRFAVLVELKKPGTELLASTRYRNGAWSIGDELSGGIAQLQANIESLLRKAHSGLANVRFLDERAMSVAAPRAILLIGKTDQLDDDDKKATFHRFRRNLWNPEVITYDELLERARFLVARSAAKVERSSAPVVLGPAFDEPGSSSDDRGAAWESEPADDDEPPEEPDEEPPLEGEGPPQEEEEPSPDDWERNPPSKGGQPERGSPRAPDPLSGEACLRSAGRPQLGVVNAAAPS